LYKDSAKFYTKLRCKCQAT